MEHSLEPKEHGDHSAHRDLHEVKEKLEKVYEGLEHAAGLIETPKSFLQEFITSVESFFLSLLGVRQGDSHPSTEVKDALKEAGIALEEYKALVDEHALAVKSLSAGPESQAAVVNHLAHRHGGSAHHGHIPTPNPVAPPQPVPDPSPIHPAPGPVPTVPPVSPPPPSPVPSPIPVVPGSRGRLNEDPNLMGRADVDDLLGRLDLNPEQRDGTGITGAAGLLFGLAGVHGESERTAYENAFGNNTIEREGNHFTTHGRDSIEVLHELLEGPMGDSGKHLTDHTGLNLEAIEKLLDEGKAVVVSLGAEHIPTLVAGAVAGESHASTFLVVDSLHGSRVMTHEEMEEAVGSGGGNGISIEDPASHHSAHAAPSPVAPSSVNPAATHPTAPPVTPIAPAGPPSRDPSVGPPAQDVPAPTVTPAAPTTTTGTPQNTPAGLVSPAASPTSSPTAPSPSGPAPGSPSSPASSPATAPPASAGPSAPVTPTAPGTAPTTPAPTVIPGPATPGLDEG